MELSLGEVVSKTFQLYRRNFVKYFVLFLTVEVVIGIVGVFAYGAFPLPTLPANPTSQQIANWAPGFFTNLILLVGVVGIASLVFGTIAYAGTIKMASEEVEGRQIDLGGAVAFAVSKMVWVWILGLVLGIILAIGYIALIVPGIILTVMFSLSFQALLIEDSGVTGSMSRSRELVGHRWLKTLAMIIVFAIIVGVASAIVSTVAAPFGYWGQLVSSVLSAFYLPIVPVATTVYFYSNRARISQTQMGPATMAPVPMPAPGTKFCTNCGAQIDASATFCGKCGARQPA